MQWKNGWLQITDNRFYWKAKRDHTSHVPFTNTILETEITLSNVLHFGFGLRQDGKVPAPEATIIIEKWRASIRGTPSTLTVFLH